MVSSLRSQVSESSLHGIKMEGRKTEKEFSKLRTKYRDGVATLATERIARL